jgi:hypothetical protein
VQRVVLVCGVCGCLCLYPVNASPLAPHSNVRVRTPPAAWCSVRVGGNSASRAASSHICRLRASRCACARASCANTFTQVKQFNQVRNCRCAACVLCMLHFVTQSAPHQDSGELAHALWLVDNTKECPGCHVTIQKNEGCL